MKAEDRDRDGTQAGCPPDATPRAVSGRRAPDARRIRRTDSTARRIAGSLLLVLAGCSTLPPPPPLTLAAPDRFLHAPEAAGGDATAADGDPWLALQDPLVPVQLARAEHNAPSVEQALARVVQARAALAIAEAGLRPQLSASVQGSRGNSFGSSGSSSGSSFGGGSSTGNTSGGSSGSNTSGGAGSISQTVSNTLTGALNLSWEVDLFGRLAAGRLAADARLQAAQADAQLARIALRSQVLDTLVSARACRLEEASQQASLASASATRQLTAVKAGAGLAPAMDLSRTEAAEGEARASLLAIQGTCAGVVESLAYLTGVPDAQVAAELAGASSNGSGSEPPAVPLPPAWQAQVPARLLATHPQIVALQQRADAAWSDLGQARTGHLPSLNLGAVLSSTLVQVSAGHAVLNSWSLGPSLAMTLLDGGRVDGNVGQAQGRYSEAVASLSAGVRDTVRDVELALIQGEYAERSARQAGQTLQASTALFRASERAQRAGRLSLFELENARTGLLAAELAMVHARRDQARAWVALLKAAGSAPAATLPSLAGAV